MERPEQEKADLSLAEQHMWQAFMLLEVRSDLLGVQCRVRLAEMLDRYHGTGLCDHDGCSAARDKSMDLLSPYLWATPR
jgi:hypothetical protein